MRYIFTCFILFNCSAIRAQWQNNAQVGFQLGGVVQLGTHVNAIGVKASMYYSNYFFQANVGTLVKYNLKSYGARSRFWENRFHLGAAILGGKKDAPVDFLIDGLNHQTTFRNALAYNYIIYTDNTGTSQRSGAWGLHLYPISFLFENDVFAGQAKDRFRTGDIELRFRQEHFSLFTNFYIWTGETRHSVWNRTPTEKCPNGFRSLENLPFGKTSHGIWSFGIHYYFLPFHTLSSKIGFDSEQVRHIIQNRLTHDLILLPKSIERNTPHYPRLNAEGKPVFTKDDNRPNRFYFQLGVNDVWSN